MTNVDPTRPRPGGAPLHLPSLDDLAERGDPAACETCLAAGRECGFHRGWAAGWDACTAFMARVVDHEHASELTLGLGDGTEIR